MLETIAQSYEVGVLETHTHGDGPTNEEVENLIKELLDHADTQERDAIHGRLLVVGHDEILPATLKLYTGQIPDPWKVSGDYAIWSCKMHKHAKDMGMNIEELVGGDWWVVTLEGV